MLTCATIFMKFLPSTSSPLSILNILAQNKALIFPIFHLRFPSFSWMETIPELFHLMKIVCEGKLPLKEHFSETGSVSKEQWTQWKWQEPIIYIIFLQWLIWHQLLSLNQYITKPQVVESFTLKLYWCMQIVES